MAVIGFQPVNRSARLGDVVPQGAVRNVRVNCPADEGRGKNFWLAVQLAYDNGQRLLLRECFT